MSRTRNEKPRPVDADPRAVHMREVDDRGPDLASMVHQLAKNVCEGLSLPCGAQGNLPEGLCIVTFEPCRFALGASGRPYAEDAVDDDGRVRESEAVERMAVVADEAAEAAAQGLISKAKASEFGRAALTAAEELAAKEKVEADSAPAGD